VTVLQVRPEWFTPDKIIGVDTIVLAIMIVHEMRTTVEARDELIGAILSDVGWSLRELRCASTEKFVKQGISMTQIHVLRQLEQHGTMSMSRIAELLDVSLSNATGIIDRMAERGLVERVRVPDDRRVVLVQPSTRGIEALDETEGIKLDRIRAICNRLEDAQLQGISQAMSDLRVAIAAEFGFDNDKAHDIHTRATSAG
jgi:DNA-binding MarR family transcriptional regulator